MGIRPRRHKTVKRLKIYDHIVVTGGVEGTFQNLVQSPEVGNLEGNSDFGGFEFVSSWLSTSFHS